MLQTEPVTTGEMAAMEEIQQGTSVAKEKHIDPREWGDVEFNDEEIDVDAQEAAIKAYNKVLIRKNKKNKRNTIRKTQVNQNPRIILLYQRQAGTLAC